MLPAEAFVIRENGEICTETKCQDSVIVPSSGRAIDIK